MLAKLHNVIHCIISFESWSNLVVGYGHALPTNNLGIQFWSLLTMTGRIKRPDPIFDRVSSHKKTKIYSKSIMGKE